TTSVCGGRYIPVQRRPDFSVDVEAVRHAVDADTKLLFVASPNNPSGNRLTAAELEDLLELPVAVVVDEAYVEFSGGSHAPLVPQASEANFILCRVTRGSAKALRDRLRERGIFLRYFGRPGLDDCIRVSVGLPEHTDALMAALAEVEP